MIISMKKGAPQEEVNKLVQYFEDQGLSVTMISGDNYNVFGLVGDTTKIAEKDVLANPWVENVTRVSAPYKRANRLFHPADTVIDVRGDVLAFGGRIVDKNDPGAKYMNTQETAVYSKRRVLYGLNLARKSRRENIILVEGNIDVVMLHQAGFDNACASMGTALTPEQIRLLSRYTREVVLCYDNDDAGKIATQKALSLLNDADLRVSVLELPKRLVDGQYVKQDADDFIKFHGADAFEHLLSEMLEEMSCSPAAKAASTSAWRRSPDSSTSGRTAGALNMPPPRQSFLQRCPTRSSARSIPCAPPKPPASPPMR